MKLIKNTLDEDEDKDYENKENIVAVQRWNHFQSRKNKNCSCNHSKRFKFLCRNL